VLALESSGVHTNGVSLVRKIIDANPAILKEKIGDTKFMDAVLVPHKAYYPVLKRLFGNAGLTGLAHITGGGIQENLNRILPRNLSAHIDLSKIRIHPIFKTLKKFGNLEDRDMLRTFNMGVGLTVVVRKSFAEQAISHFEKHGVQTYIIGDIRQGNQTVEFSGALQS
jgi:phosphoribosylformylglycinamidine cyclo-ligase